ncbi:conserved hypothetical protein [Ricinus communis]|uniref:Uncharacterized protein n=1 Tax=Ricinus communis TaxID=3988 RepID=B9SZ84_RICCO|nr:conserved hypothetical protein [Ricinus communis]
MVIRLAQNFTSITRLALHWGDPQLTSLPDSVLQNHTLHEDIKIVSLYGLKSLSNQPYNLPALKYLHLEERKELESMREGLCSLNSLERLHISRCGINSFPPPREWDM